MAITSFQQLSSVLQEEYNIASQLLVILNSERDALVKSETEIMDKMSADKQPLIVKLEQLGRQRELIVQADGGHVKTTENDKRSFEIMSAKLYRPESVVEITEIRNEMDKI